MDVLRAAPSRFDEFASDPETLSVLQKMRRMHGVAQANGQRTISLEDMLVGGDGGWRQRDEQRQRALAAGLAAEAAAVAAALVAEPGSAAKDAEAAHEAVLKEAVRADLDAVAAAAGPKLSAPKQSRAALTRSGVLSGSTSSATSTEAAGAVLEKEEEEARAQAAGEENMPEWMKGGFTWKKVGEEFVKQCRQALLMMLLVMAVMLVLRGGIWLWQHVAGGGSEAAGSAAAGFLSSLGAAFGAAAGQGGGEVHAEL